jgi:hypothetical protein
MSRQSLGARLEALESIPAPVRRPNRDDAASARLRAALAAEMGIDAAAVFRGDHCPAMALLRHVVDGIADPDELAIFERVARVRYFEKVETADFLRAVVRVHREF